MTQQTAQQPSAASLEIENLQLKLQLYGTQAQVLQMQLRELESMHQRDQAKLQELQKQNAEQNIIPGV